nr:UPF0236 family protein [Virgibacillus pantothenticus]
MQDFAIELAVTGVSYRQASRAMEKLLGYPVISHEGIRQQLLNTVSRLSRMSCSWKWTGFIRKVKRKIKKAGR